MSTSQRFAQAERNRAKEVLQSDSSLLEPETVISYNRSPLMNNPEMLEGYQLVSKFTSYRGRVCGEYRDSNTGEHVYLYGDPDRTAI